MARATFAPLSKNSAVRARRPRSSSAGPRRPSRTELLYPAARSPGRAPLPLGASARRGRPAPPGPGPRRARDGAGTGRTGSARPEARRCLVCEPMQEGARPTLMEPSKAADAIRARVDAATPLTVADASAKTGLALRDAESGLKWLSREYRGQLRVTSEGDLVYLFPHGFAKPWERRDALSRAARAAGRALMGALRFVVRAWVAIVLVGYAAVFVALVLGMAFARQGNDDSRRNGDLPGAFAYAFLRVVGDALFWTFHPWSPFYVGTAGGWDVPAGAGAYGRPRARTPKTPLYER